MGPSADNGPKSANGNLPIGLVSGGQKRLNTKSAKIGHISIDMFVLGNLILSGETWHTLHFFGQY